MVFCSPSHSTELVERGCGWRQDAFAFYEADINRPSGRNASFSPTTYEVNLYRDARSVENGQVDARLTVNASDWPEVESGSFGYEPE